MSDNTGKTGAAHHAATAVTVNDDVETIAAALKNAVQAIVAQEPDLLLGAGKATRYVTNQTLAGAGQKLGTVARQNLYRAATAQLEQTSNPLGAAVATRLQQTRISTTPVSIRTHPSNSENREGWLIAETALKDDEWQNAGNGRTGRWQTIYMLDATGELWYGNMAGKLWRKPTMKRYAKKIGQQWKLVAEPQLVLSEYILDTYKQRVSGTNTTQPENTTRPSA